jgi:hypothetical protein
MKRTLSGAFLISTIAIWFVLASLCSFGAAADTSARFKVSGYITDSNGAGVGGAEIIFCVPDLVPSVRSNLTGYYEIWAPAGIYHMDVWPPFDTNYMSYDLPQLSVQGDMVKNVTLLSGYKVSGYVTYATGQTIPKGVVFLTQTSFSGWYTNSAGYYFLSAPAGTYTLTVKPANQGNTFPVYTETVVISGTTVKNITLPSNSPTPPANPTEEPTPTASPTPNPNSKPTPTLTITCRSIPTSADFEVEIAGTITYHNAGLSAATVSLFYSTDNGATWHDLTQLETEANGGYSILWFPQLGGNYLMKTVFDGNDDYGNAVAEANLAVVSVAPESVFSVTSNSTLSALSFNSATMELSFSVSGPTGTFGYVNVNIPKSLVSDITNLKVLIDNSEVSFTAEEGDTVWFLSFTYHHSTHSVNIAFSPDTAQANQVAAETPIATQTSPPITQMPTPQSSQSPQVQPTSEPTQTPSTQTPQASDFYMVVSAALAVVVVVLALALVWKRKAKND